MSKVAGAKMLTSDSALRVVKIADLQVDPSYQREIRGKHRKIVSNFDKNALGIILVGQREDGSLWVVDGLQRKTALEKLGKETVRAEVFVSKGPEHEAEVFRLVNQNRTALSSPELFRAKLAAGDKTAWEIKKLVESLGLIIGYVRKRNGRPGDWKVISAINTLERVEQRYGLGVLELTLETVKASWPEDLHAFASDIIFGVGVWISRHDGVIDTDSTVPKFRTATPAKILYSSGLGVGDRPNNVADVLEKLSRKRMIRK